MIGKKELAELRALDLSKGVYVGPQAIDEFIQTIERLLNDVEGLRKQVRLADEMNGALIGRLEELEKKK